MLLVGLFPCPDLCLGSILKMVAGEGYKIVFLVPSSRYAAFKLFLRNPDLYRPRGSLEELSDAELRGKHGLHFPSPHVMREFGIEIFVLRRGELIVIPPAAFHWGLNVGSSVCLSVNYVSPTLVGFMADYNRSANDLLDFVRQVHAAPLDGSTLEVAWSRADATLTMWRELFHSCRRHCCISYYAPGLQFAADVHAFLNAARNQRRPVPHMTELTEAALRVAHNQWRQQLDSREAAGDPIPCTCGKPPPYVMAAKAARTKQRKGNKHANDETADRSIMEDEADGADEPADSAAVSNDDAVATTPQMEDDEDQN